MDITQAAKYFDRQKFDAYNFGASAWVLAAFTGQLKSADTFVSIWNRPTRKRMLYTAPDQVPTSTVIRVPTTGEIFMVGTSQKDSIMDTSYRVVCGLHRVAGVAQVNRKTPVEVAGVKGWAVNALVRNSFGDVELRSVNESQDRELTNYGHFFLFMPSDEALQRHDTVTLNGATYYVLEVYPDSGYITARVTANPDERVDFTYTSKGVETYNPATQSVSSADTLYNVTGKITPVSSEDVPNSEILKERVNVMLLESFISFEPKVADKLTYLGKTYTVEKVERNAILSEWYLVACL